MILPAPQQLRLETEMQRRSVLYFATRMMEGPPEDPYRGRFLAGDHHFEWDALLTGNDRVLVQAPRDHGKSFYWNKAYPIWKAYFGRRGDLGYIFSNTQERAIEMLQAIKEEIVGNPKLQHLAPRNWEQRWSQKRIRTTNGVEIRARGAGTAVRGGHPHWIVGDDIYRDDAMTSEAIRKKIEEWWFSSVTNMIVPGGQIVLVGTPMHQADIYQVIKRSGRYAVWEKPALDKETGHALWPLRYNRALLDERLQEIGSVRFTREFLVQPFSDEMSLFPSYLFEGKPVQQYQAILNKPAAYWDALGVTKRFMGIDIAMSANTGADYMVIFTIGLDKFENRWVCGIERHQGMGFQAQLDLINTTARKMNPGLIFIEANQMQRVWGDELIRTTSLPIKKFVTTGSGKAQKRPGQSQTSNKNSLEVGVPSLVPLLENKKFRIPRGDAQSVEMTDIWMREMQAMSFVDGKVQGVGEHDDTCMACWIADQAVRIGGFSFSFGEDEDISDFDPEELLRETAPEKEPDPEDQDVPQVPPNGSNGSNGHAPADNPLGLYAEDQMADPLWTAVPFFKG